MISGSHGGGTSEALRRALPLGAFLAARATESLGALSEMRSPKALVETDRRGLSFAP